jgi:hypothetical protein
MLSDDSMYCMPRKKSKGMHRYDNVLHRNIHPKIPFGPRFFMNSTIRNCRPAYAMRQKGRIQVDSALSQPMLNAEVL